MEIEISVELDAPVDTVWADIEDLTSHVEWMADAESIEFPGAQKTGEGTVMNVLTKIGPLTTMDVLTVTDWDPPHRMGVEHSGVVTGSGAFTLTDLGDNRTRFTWAEELEMPWYFGGRLGQPVSGAVMRGIWKRNLRRLKERF